MNALFRSHVPGVFCAKSLTENLETGARAITAGGHVPVPAANLLLTDSSALTITFAFHDEASRRDAELMLRAEYRREQASAIAIAWVDDDACWRAELFFRDNRVASMTRAPILRVCGALLMGARDSWRQTTLNNTTWKGVVT